MQGSHTHIPGTNNVPRGYIVAAILSLLFMVPLCLVPALALLFFYVSTFRSMCAVPNMAVFCSSLTSRFPVMSLTCYYYWAGGCTLLISCGSTKLSIKRRKHKLTQKIRRNQTLTQSASNVQNNAAVHTDLYRKDSA